jgi:DNA polymerase III subunit gamma/tau
MSLALYRRYRPERFADVIGQAVISQTLRNEVRAKTPAHAYLFAGMRGTGKTSTARILARAVNCLQPQDGEPCNTCVACVEILQGASVDVLEIDAASNRGIDEMRDLRDKVKYLPASLRRKVYIIDEAHMLTTEAWNAFLKTLEEPPDHVMFVLATTEPHKVPETVRSRVQRFDFRRVSTADLETHLLDVVAREEAAVEREAIELLARAAQGSVRDALSLLDQSLALGERPLTVVAARRALGLTDPATLHRLMRALAGSDAADVLRAASIAFDAGADPRQLLRDASRLARAAELYALGYPEGADVPAEEAALCADLAAIAPPGFWIAALDSFTAIEMNLRQPIDARLQVELALLRLLRPAVTSDTDASSAVARLEARLEALERKVRSGATAADVEQGATIDSAPQAATSQGVVAAADDAAGARDFESVEGWRSEWPLLIEAMGRINAQLAGVIRDCRPVDAGPGRLTIGTNGKFHYEQISDPAKARLLSEAASTLSGVDVVVDARFTGEANVPKEAPGTVSDLTQAVLDTFAGSRVTSTRIRDDAGSRAPRSGDA